MTEPMTFNRLLSMHGIDAKWTFTTYYRGVHAQSPRVFDSIDDVLRAVVEKLNMHAQDHEYPMVSLLMLTCSARGGS